MRDAFKKLADPKVMTRPVMRDAAGALHEASEYAFEQQKDPNTGEAWKPWTDDWKKWREDHGYTPGKILTLSGQLATSLTTDYGDDYALIGSNKVYAAIHQWGGLPRMAPGPAAIPERPYMGLDDTGEELILSSIDKSLYNALSGS
ncbi:phage virion morphogenesis protein [Rahnella contaminans]|uniref:phage virion morphogenesis protein n=1 Tax=Rahnella contaminans TaxID=2703882 RepID=UPI003C2D4B56